MILLMELSSIIFWKNDVFVPSREIIVVVQRCSIFAQYCQVASLNCTRFRTTYFYIQHMWFSGQHIQTATLFSCVSGYLTGTCSYPACIAVDFSRYIWFLMTVFVFCTVLVYGEFGDTQHIGCFDQACDVLAIARGLLHFIPICSSLFNRVLLY